MRLIDADALKDEIRKYANEPLKLCDRRWDTRCTAIIADMNGLINEMPTIQPDSPMVMTLADICEVGDDKPLFIEYKLPSETKLKPAIFQPESSDDEYMCVVSAWCASGFYSRKSYNMDWRCWTAQPTDEQRKAAKWDDA